MVRVAPDVPAIHRRFDYAVPAALEPAVTVGARVRIGLHGRRVGGWVVEDGVTPTAGVLTKDLAGSSGLGPPPTVVALAEWAAWRWAGPLTSFLGTASPDRVVRSLGPPATGAPGRPPASPGGGAVALVGEVLDGGGPAVVRLAPALDAGRIVLEVVHRLGPAGVLVVAASRTRVVGLAGRLRAAGVPVAVLPDEWALARRGTTAVVGTRRAAWAPLERVHAVVVLDAHDEAHREERAPTWSAVDVVLERGRRDAAPVVLVSPCPPVTLLGVARSVTTDRAVERSGWPRVEVVDRAGDDPRTGLFSERLVAAGRAELGRAGGRVVCVLNRTGRVKLLACSACGVLARCTRCGGAVGQADRSDRLSCRRCGETRPALCAACDSTRLKTLRIGVGRAAEELAALLGTGCVEITATATEDAVSETTRLVVGTEAALHRVEHAGLVAFLDFDQHLLAPRFAASEQALALLARAARVVGAWSSGGRVLVQTRLPRHEVLQAAAQADPELVAAPERDLRRRLGLPPFGALALLSGPGAEAYAAGLAGVGDLEVSPLDADRYLVRAADHAALADGLGSVARPHERLRVEVDPVDV